MTARVALGLSLALGLLTAACGFQPMYGASGADAALSRIRVETPDHRLGFELRQQLEDALGFDRSQPSLWTLTTRTGLERTPLGRRIDDTVTRYELTLTVEYDLSSSAGGQPYRDRITATTTYASTDQAYAAVAAQRDGEARVVAEAARLLRLDLARLVDQPGA